MTLEQIKQAVQAGRTVHWVSTAYRVICDRLGRFLILCDANQDCIGLTHRDGVTLNGRESQFFEGDTP